MGGGVKSLYQIVMCSSTCAKRFAANNWTTDGTQSSSEGPAMRVVTCSMLE